MELRWLKILGLLFTLCLGFASPSIAETPSPEDFIVEEIGCVGNETLPCDRIKQELHLSPGEKVDEREIRQARLRLALTGLFHDVEIYLRKGSKRGNVRIVIEVAEDSPLYSLLQLGSVVYGTRASSIGALTFGHRSIFGSESNLYGSVRYQKNLTDALLENFSGQVGFVVPHLLGSKDFFLNSSITYINHKENAPNASLRNSSIYFVGEIGRRFGNFWFISAGYRYRSVLKYRLAVDGVEYGQNLLNNRVAFLSTGYSREDDIYFPRTGASFVATVGSRFSFEDPLYSLALGFRKHWLLSEKVILSLNAGSTSRAFEFRNTDYLLEHEDLPISLRLSYEWARNQHHKRIKTGRAYIEAGYTVFDRLEKMNEGLGLKIGTRMNTGTFGLVDLYFMYVNTLWRDGL